MKPLLALLLAFSLFAAENPIRGFPSDQLPKQRELETRARGVPDPARIRAYVQRMSSEPHHAGTPASKAVAEYALGLFKEWGLDARIEVFEALLPYQPIRQVPQRSQP